MDANQKEKELRQFFLTIYGAYAASALLQFFEATLWLGLFLLTVAYILLVRRKDTTGTPYESHLRWLNRTLWIGSLVYAPLSMIVSMGLIYTFTDLSAIIEAFNSGSPDALMNSVNTYIATSGGMMNLLVLIGSAPTALWWLHRCWTGFSMACGGAPVDNVTRWS